MELPFSALAPIEGLERQAYYIMVVRDLTEPNRQATTQTRFVATAAHQLRTPLASLKTAIDLLVEKGQDIPPNLRERLLKTIQSSSQRMGRLVSELIELTNLQSGHTRLDWQRVNVTEVIRQVVAECQPLMTARQQKLETELEYPTLEVKADAVRLKKVLQYLVANASRFSQSDTSVTLRVKLEAGLVVIAVQDQGIGIAHQEQKLIFEEFYQSQVIQNSLEPSGGLGLPLARTQVELLSGRMWCESALGYGSTFYVALPVIIEK